MTSGMKWVNQFRANISIYFDAFTYSVADANK